GALRSFFGLGVRCKLDRLGNLCDANLVNRQVARVFIRLYVSKFLSSFREYFFLHQSCFQLQKLFVE
ncbi:MAG: hypothetical protein VYE67_09060, partial [Planctomycetota bacterium]|nr:hypothetical protein [Planctomycetota bacterium]